MSNVIYLADVIAARALEQDESAYFSALYDFNAAEQAWCDAYDFMQATGTPEAAQLLQEAQAAAEIAAERFDSARNEYVKESHNG